MSPILHPNEEHFNNTENVSPPSQSLDALPFLKATTIRLLKFYHNCLSTCFSSWNFSYILDLSFLLYTCITDIYCQPVVYLFVELSILLSISIFSPFWEVIIFILSSLSWCPNKYFVFRRIEETIYYFILEALYFSFYF